MYKLIILLLSVILVGCRSGFVDLSKDLPVRELTRISTGTFLDIAWQSDHTFIVVIDEGSTKYDNGFMTYHPKLAIIDEATNDIIPVSVQTTCLTYFVGGLHIQSEKIIRYIFDCPQLNSTIIKELNTETIQSKDIYVDQYNPSFGRFTYSADMEEIIFVDVEGLYLKSRLHHLDSSGNETNITPEFLRAEFPEWSPKNNLVAFMGTKPYPGSDDPIQHFSQTEGLLDYPWRMYFYDPHNQTTEELPLDIFHPSSLKWSPDGRRLAFAGDYKGTTGIWIVDNLANHDDLKLTRVVDGLAAFDFSPDGNSIIYAYIGLLNTEKQNILYVVDLDPIDKQP